MRHNSKPGNCVFRVAQSIGFRSSPLGECERGGGNRIPSACEDLGTQKTTQLNCRWWRCEDFYAVCAHVPGNLFVQPPVAGDCCASCRCAGAGASRAKCAGLALCRGTARRSAARRRRAAFSGRARMGRAAQRTDRGPGAPRYGQADCRRNRPGRSLAATWPHGGQLRELRHGLRAHLLDRV